MGRIVLFTKQPVLAEGLKCIVASCAGLQLTATFHDLDQLIDGLPADWQEVLLLELTPDLSFFKLAAVRNKAPAANIVLWVSSISVETAHQAREFGVRGILRKDLSTELTLRCLDKVSMGERWFDRALTESLLEARTVHLSRREQQLLQLVSHGLSNKEIGATLMITEGTVKVYFSKLFRKVGVRDRFELALHGIRNLGEMSSVEAAPNHEERPWPRSVIMPASSPRDV